MFGNCTCSTKFSPKIIGPIPLTLKYRFTLPRCIVLVVVVAAVTVRERIKSRGGRIAGEQDLLTLPLQNYRNKNKISNSPSLVVTHKAHNIKCRLIIGQIKLADQAEQVVCVCVCARAVCACYVCVHWSAVPVRVHARGAQERYTEFWNFAVLYGGPSRASIPPSLT